MYKVLLVFKDENISEKIKRMNILLMKMNITLLITETNMRQI